MRSAMKRGEGLARQERDGADDGDEDETGVADAGIAQEPLQIALGNGGEIAEKEGKNGGDAQDRHPNVGAVGGAKDAQDDAHENDEAPGLGTHGKKAVMELGRAFVDVGGPRCGRGTIAILKPMADEDEEQAEGDAGPQVNLKFEGDGIETGGAGESENVGNAHDQKGGGEAAEDKIFDSGLERDRACGAGRRPGCKRRW